jgi:hypothetical protein
MTDSEINKTTYEVWVQHTEGDKPWYPRREGFDTLEAARQYVEEHTLNYLRPENFKVFKAERSTKFTVQA